MRGGDGEIPSPVLLKALQRCPGGPFVPQAQPLDTSGPLCLPEDSFTLTLCCGCKATSPSVVELETGTDKTNTRVNITDYITSTILNYEDDWLPS